MFGGPGGGGGDGGGHWPLHCELLCTSQDGSTDGTCLHWPLFSQWLHCHCVDGPGGGPGAEWQNDSICSCRQPARCSAFAWLPAQNSQPPNPPVVRAAKHCLASAPAQEGAPPFAPATADVSVASSSRATTTSAGAGREAGIGLRAGLEAGTACILTRHAVGVKHRRAIALLTDSQRLNGKIRC